MIMKTVSNLNSEYLPSDQLSDKTWYKTSDGSNLWYYWLDKIPNLKNEPDDVDDSLKELTHFLISNNFDTLPSCEGHLNSESDIKSIWNKLINDMRAIKGSGLELVNTEDKDDVILFKDPDYKLPFKEPSDIITEEYSGYFGIKISDEDLLKSIYLEVSQIDEDIYADIDGSNLNIYVKSNNHHKQKELWKEITNVIKDKISELNKSSRFNHINSLYKIASDPKVGTGKKPKGSSRRLYTDENPKDTVPIKFKTISDIRETLSRADFRSKSHKRQSQIINLIHQRVRAAYQNAKNPEVKSRLKKALQYAKDRRRKSKEKTKRMQKKAHIEFFFKIANHVQTRNLDNPKLPPFFRKNLDYGERESFLKKRKLSNDIKDYNAPRTGKGVRRWSVKYKKKINCSNPKGFSQKQYCKRKRSGGKYKSK